MKRIIFCLITVVMLVMMMLPADIAVAKGHRVHDLGATNTTSESNGDDIAVPKGRGGKIHTANDETNESTVADLVADFVFDVPGCPLCEGITFTDQSTGGTEPYKYDWDFGDGGSSSKKNPTHYYTSCGNYTVTLTVTDRAGDVDTESNTVTVGEALKATTQLDGDITPMAVVGSWPRCVDGCTANDVEINSVWLDIPTGDYTPGQTITGNVWMNLYFHRTNTYCIIVVADLYEAGNITELNWVSNVIEYNDHGGDQTYPMGSVNWTYGKLFEMRNVLVEWSQNDPGDGCPEDCSVYHSPSKCTKVSNIIVRTPLVAEFSAEPVCYCNDTMFTDETTGGNTDEPYTYSWDFGGGYNYTGEDPTGLKNPVIHYYAHGIYNVTLNVTDFDGETSSVSHDVTVYPNPICHITADPGTEVCASNNVTLTEDSGDAVSWDWTTAETTQSIVVSTSGTYGVTITDENGCESYCEVEVTVYEEPTCHITADPGTEVYAGTEVTLTEDSGDAVSWDWTTAETTQSIVVSTSGTYGVTITGDNGCTHHCEITVTVLPPPPPPPRRGGGGCPTNKYLTVDWEGNNTTKLLYSNDQLAVDLLGPSTDGIHSLFLEKGTHAPIVDGETYYLIVVRELEGTEIPALQEDYVALVVFNITPDDAVFDRDIFLTLGLDELQLPENIIEGTITMVYYDDISGTWVELEFEAGGPPNSVAELSLSTALNHFSIFGVLAELEPISPPPQANFVASGLSIEPSVEKIWEIVTFVTKTGESVTITANVVNDGGQEGTYTVVLKLNGETVDTKTVTLGAGQSQQVSFTVSGLDYGQYEVEVAGLSDEFTTSRAITWWLIIVLIVALGLIIWGVVWGRRRRRRAHQEV